jgi:hypothetical protein
VLASVASYTKVGVSWLAFQFSGALYSSYPLYYRVELDTTPFFPVSVATLTATVESNSVVLAASPLPSTTVAGVTTMRYKITQLASGSRVYTRLSALSAPGVFAGGVESTSIPPVWGYSGVPHPAFVVPTVQAPPPPSNATLALADVASSPSTTSPTYLNIPSRLLLTVYDPAVNAGGFPTRDGTSNFSPPLPPGASPLTPPPP